MQQTNLQFILPCDVCGSNYRFSKNSFRMIIFGHNQHTKEGENEHFLVELFFRTCPTTTQTVQEEYQMKQLFLSEKNKKKKTWAWIKNDF